jgi:hypothetical protein
VIDSDSTRQAPAGWLFFSWAVAAVVLVLAVVPPVAAGEATDGLPEAVPPAAESSTSVTPVEQVETQVATTAAAVSRVEAPEPQSLTNAVTTAVSGSPSSTPAEPPAPVQSRAAGHVPSLQFDGGPAGTVDTSVVTAPSSHYVEGLVGGARDTSETVSKTVAAAIDRTAQSVETRVLQPAGGIVQKAPLAEQLSKVTGTLRGALTSLLDSVPIPPAVADLLPTPAVADLLPTPAVADLLPSTEGVEAFPSHGAPGLDRPLLSTPPLVPRHLIETGWPSMERLVGLSGLEYTDASFGPAAGWSGAPLAEHLTTVGAGDAKFEAQQRSPLDMPLPSPDSPGAATSGSGTTFFVPLAALLALLALVAPATLRRLREVPGFPAPIPFVCALERPG